MNTIPLKPINTKVLLLGLDNSGKSSILLSLRENANLLSYCSLRPTKGIHIENFETEEISMTCWDSSGQQKYRDKYLNQSGKIKKELDKIIFVIDVQDYKRYDLALDFLYKIIEDIKKDNIVIDLSIFLHKYDPNLKNLEEFKDVDERINLGLINKIKNIIPSKFHCKLFKTTIYTVFEKSLVRDYI